MCCKFGLNTLLVIHTNKSHTESAHNCVNCVIRTMFALFAYSEHSANDATYANNNAKMHAHACEHDVNKIYFIHVHRVAFDKMLALLKSRVSACTPPRLFPPLFSPLCSTTLSVL